MTVARRFIAGSEAHEARVPEGTVGLPIMPGIC
jgi:hypothetical protein